MARPHLGLRAPAFSQVVWLLVATTVALFFGLMSAVLPAWFVLSVLIVPAVAVLLVLRPEYALLALVALTCGLVHPAVVPRLPVLGGSLSAADATLVMLMLAALWILATRARAPAPQPFARYQPQAAAGSPAPVAGIRLLTVSLVLFGLSFVVCVATSLLFRDQSQTAVLGETRDLLYLMVGPAAVVILQPPQRQRRFLVGFVVLGCLFAIGQVLQGVFKVDVFGTSGRLVVLETLGRTDYGTTRTLTLGISAIVFALLVTLGAYALGGMRKAVFFAVAALLFSGIFLTFGRTTYAMVVVSVVVLLWWLNFKLLAPLTAMLALSLALLAGVGSLWKPDSVAAVVYRMTSIGTEIESGYSAQWRIWEAEAMLPQIAEHPLLGLGLGADYKGLRNSTVDAELNRYVHNAYLYMAGKMGLPALLFFLTAMGAVFAMGRRLARRQAPLASRVVGAAAAALMVYFALASFTEPHFMSDYSLVVMALVGAMVVLRAPQAQGAAHQAAVTQAAARPVAGLATRWARR